ncbi:hypothetical protein BJX63DRAFT_315355 [Aspergillus granulosus]|uniref:Uncharacterized protein n=1 Tax=Aspergillus granulosus TaxID=176169 RepID=A0ABR4H543_9EURO
MSLHGIGGEASTELLETTAFGGDYGGGLRESESTDSLQFDIDSIFSPREMMIDGDNAFLDGGLQQPEDGLLILNSEPSVGHVKMSRAAVQTLKQWFDQHADTPYPSKYEKAMLAQRAGLSLTQVSTWFANARRRQKYRSARGNGGLTLQRRDSLEIFNTGKANEMMNPLERWRNSPPEAEPASLDAIMNAVVKSRRSDHLHEPGVSPRSTPNDSRSIASSNRSGSGISSSHSSIQSFASHSSNGSFNRFYATEPRRRRRRGKPTAIRAKGGQERPFQCTFCTDTFRTKYDWTRHEKTLHLSLESYICCPCGPTYTGLDAIIHCVFCDHPNPSQNHLESHCYSSCQGKPTTLRTFYRKDHLVQHLRLVHGVNRFLPSMDSWKSQVDRVNSRCGICSETFELWSERTEHLAQHFREGASMKEWQGHRGLDPAVALAVENAMPPYLIGMEAATMDPFSATRSANAHWSFGGCLEQIDPLTGTAKPTPSEYFTAQLTARIRRAQEANEVITDERIHAEARQVLYGEDDPWNQTPADNAEWLRLFKLGLGLFPEDPPGEEWFPGPYTREETDFFLPWSAEVWKPWADPHGNQLTAESSESWMAWPWQSPEALADFRRFCTQVFAAGGQEAPGDLDCRVLSPTHYETPGSRSTL